MKNKKPNLAMNLTHNLLLVLGCGCLLAASQSLAADEKSTIARQNGGSGTSATNVVPSQSEGVVELSPFVVSSAGDDGYRAANTLSGTRMNMRLFQTPAQISVMTKEFLEDIGAENAQDLLKFAASSEHNRTEAADTLAQAFDVLATVRGFKESVITRDYMPNMVENRGILAAELFNVERADFSRGPNSILYGASRPGGAINTNSKRAIINGRQMRVIATVGRFAKKRTEADFAFPIIKDKLSLRTNALFEDRKGWFEFEGVKQKGLAFATTYQPFKTTQVRAGVERLVRDQVLGISFPHADFGYSSWVKGGKPLAADPLLPQTNPAPSLLRSVNTLQTIYAPQIRSSPYRLSTTGADMRPDLVGNQPSGFWETISGAAAPSGGTVDDPYYGQVIPVTAYLSGPGRSANLSYTVASVFLDQRIRDVSIELGYTRSTYNRGFRGGTDNAVGDPNSVLPGAYFADGDSAIGPGREPGTLLPDIGRRNPFAGTPYVQSQFSEQYFQQTDETFRVGVAYKLDLEKTSRWLGRHSFAGFLQDQRNLIFGAIAAEYNLAPNNSQLIDSPTNIILRRTYLDFSTPGGLRGALDPRKNPIPTGPGMKPQMVYQGVAGYRITKNASWMVAMQSGFIDDRLMFTGGYRNEEVALNSTYTTGSGGQRVPNSTNLWFTPQDAFNPASEAVYSGPTKTLGAVVTPLPWMALTINRSQSFYPQQFLNIFSQQSRPIEGEGTDYGLRFNLLRERLSANITVYNGVGAFQASGVTTPRTQAVPALNAILTALSSRGAPLPPSLIAAGLRQLDGGPSSRETTDFEAKGEEIEITGRLAPGWSVSLNYSQNKLVNGNIAPDMNGFIASMKSAWDGSPSTLIDTPATVATYVRTRDSTPSRDFVTNPATFNDAYDYAVSVMDLINLASGKAPLQHTEKRFNVFTSYRFNNEAWSFFKQSRIGIGANYQGPKVIGYDAANRNEPILGKSFTVANVMMGKRFPLKGRQAIDIQINVDNVFKNERLLPYSAVSPGNVVRYILPPSRYNWTLRGTYTF